VVACLVGAVAGVTAATGMVAISRPPAAAWPTVVSVDTSYADAPVARGLRFAPLLSVETSFPPAGGDRATATAAAAPVLSVDRSFAGVPLPAALPFGREQQRRLLALAAAAQYVGFAVCIRHARKTKRAVATRIAASRLGV